MQSALQMPDLGGLKATKVAVTRILTIDLQTMQTKQYLYLLDNPAVTGDAVSEITALSNTRFLIDERDGNFEPFANKTLYEVDTNGATDITGLTINGLSPEGFVGADDTKTALAALTAAGVRVAQKQPYLQVGSLVSQLDPTGGFFGHDRSKASPPPTADKLCISPTTTTSASTTSTTLGTRLPVPSRTARGPCTRRCCPAPVRRTTERSSRGIWRGFPSCSRPRR
jgi:hypothetical protein